MTIYFDENMEAWANEIDHPTASVPDEVWEVYCMDPVNSTWTIRDGQFVELTPLADIQAKESATQRITELKELLVGTDYVVTKISEAQIEDPVEAETLKQRYAETLAQRKEWRAEINRLQEQYGLE